MLDPHRLLSPRAKAIDASGIRRVFELGATMRDPINLSIGQPDFGVPDALKRAAIEAIEQDKNAYSMTQGVEPLLRRVRQQVSRDLGWPSDIGRKGASTQAMVTAGTSAALVLMMLSLLSEPEDEIVIPDPYFVAYPNMATLAGGKAVLCDTYPDLRMTAERVEPLITARTKAVLCVSPSNPAGVVLTEAECRDLLELCRAKDVVLISDEIYDEFTFASHRVETPGGSRAPSPARFDGAHEDVLVIRGFGKTYGCTGWRMGYAAGPAWLIGKMSTLQQYTWVCAPTPLQHGCVASFDVDMRSAVDDYAKRCARVLEVLSPLTRIPEPGGAFYAFVEVPEKLGMTGTQLFEAAVQRNLLVIPGEAFSSRDTHFRLSFATAEDRLEEGLAVLADMLG
jgi:aminotransferase